jgi:hypothetical protein
MSSTVRCKDCRASFEKAIGPCPHCGGEVELSVALTGVEAKALAGTVREWQTHSYAPEWFADARAQAGEDKGPSSRRREIVFAVCAAEAYLLEWVRDDVLDRDFETLASYFPPGDHLGIRYRWKNVTKKLSDDGRIKAITWGGSDWQDFVTLVKYRDGLVHAGSSRPENPDLPLGHGPHPTPSQLASLPAGWATGVLAKLIRHIHNTLGTDPPVWISA